MACFVFQRLDEGTDEDPCRNVGFSLIHSLHARCSPGMNCKQIVPPQLLHAGYFVDYEDNDPWRLG